MFLQTLLHFALCHWKERTTQVTIIREAETREAGVQRSHSGLVREPWQAPYGQPDQCSFHTQCGAMDERSESFETKNDSLEPRSTVCWLSNHRQIIRPLRAIATSSVRLE